MKVMLLFYLVDQEEDLGDDQGALARVDRHLVEHARLLQHAALLQPGKGVGVGWKGWRWCGCM